MTDIIIGVDPGDTTGIALLDLGDLSFSSWQTTRASTLIELGSVCDSVLRLGRHPCFAVERFIHGMKAGRHTRHIPADISVNIQAYAINRFGTDMMYITPSAAEAKRFTNRHLRHLGWFASRQEHANDAARHVLFMLVQRHPDVVDKLFTDYTI